MTALSQATHIRLLAQERINTASNIFGTRAVAPEVLPNLASLSAARDRAKINYSLASKGLASPGDKTPDRSLIMTGIARTLPKARSTTCSFPTGSFPLQGCKDILQRSGQNAAPPSAAVNSRRKGGRFHGMQQNHSRN